MTVLALGAAAAQPAVALPAAVRPAAVRPVLAAEKQPIEAACAYHNVANKLLTRGQAAAPTWPEQLLQYSRAWRFSRGEGVTVAVVDSGVDGEHEQLTGHVVEGKDVTTGRVRPGGTTDCAAHGTAVAGIIVAQQVPGRAMTGVAPGATVLPVRQTWGIDDFGNPTRSTADALLVAIRAAVDSGASVVNVSVTVPDNQLRKAQRDQFNDLAQYASDRDVLIVAASGNRSEYPRTEGRLVTYPAQLAAWYRNVIAVTGITSEGAVDDDAITGPFVTLAAPGRGFPSTMSNGGLISVAGTSFAAPIVSGAAALVRSRFPDATAAQVRARLEATADHPSTDLPDPRVGYGVVDPVAALTTVLATDSTAPSGPATAAPLAATTDPDADRKAAALAAGGGALLVTMLVVAGALVVRRGRRRGWRPGNRVVVSR